MNFLIKLLKVRQLKIEFNKKAKQLMFGFLKFITFIF